MFFLAMKKHLQLMSLAMRTGWSLKTVNFKYWSEFLERIRANMLITRHSFEMQGNKPY